MNNLSTIFEGLLVELSGEEIHNTYYKDIPLKTFIRIVKSDPFTQISGGTFKVGKYSKLLLTLFRKNLLKLEDLPKATEYLTYVYKHKIPLDLTKIRSLGDVYSLIEKFVVKETTDVFQILKFLRPNEYKKLHDGEKWVIYQPLTEKSACYLGVGSEWCTTWGPNSLNPKNLGRNNQFGNYSRNDNPLYILVNKEKSSEKYQFDFNTSQFMDKDDRSFDVKNLIETNIELRDFFFPSFIKQVDETGIREQLKRIKILPLKDSKQILNLFYDEIKVDNIFAQKIINEDDSVEELIECDDLKYGNSVIFDDKKIVFTFKKSIYMYNRRGYEMCEIYQGLENLQQNAYNIEEYLRNTSYNYFDGEPEMGNDILKSYYDIHKKTAYENITNYFPTFEKFEEFFSKKFLAYIPEHYGDAIVDLNSSTYESYYDTEMKNIRDYIDFDYDEVRIPIIYFVIFVLKFNITKIGDDLIDVIDKYIEDMKISYNDDEQYDIVMVFPEYGNDDNPTFNWAVDDFFEKDFDLENIEECKGYFETFKRIHKDLFKMEDTVENEHAKVQITNFNIDCSEGKIEISYLNKDTGKTYNGKVKVDNLASYITNYSLFESLITFKKNII